MLEHFFYIKRNYVVSTIYKWCYNNYAHILPDPIIFRLCSFTMLLHNEIKKNYLQLSTNTINNSKNILFIHFRSPFAHILMFTLVVHFTFTCDMLFNMHMVIMQCSCLFDYKIKQLCAVFNIKFWRTYFHRTCNFFLI